jgi:hypothetical protein
MYGREVENKGRAQIRRRVNFGGGVSVADVISSFGSVLMYPQMQTEKTVLRLIESNAVLEYLVLNASSLFGVVDLEQMASKVHEKRLKLVGEESQTHTPVLRRNASSLLVPDLATSSMGLSEDVQQSLQPKRSMTKPLPVADSDSDE